MIDAELKKNIKNDPVVEYDIPKRIFTIAPPLPAEGEKEGEDTVKGLKQVMRGDTLADLWAF